MVPLNATSAATAHTEQQEQSDATTHTPHRLADAEADIECKISASGSDAVARSSRRPALAIRTVTQCLCGEDLCGFDCHFLQKEFEEFAAAELRRRSRRRPRPSSDAAAADVSARADSKRSGSDGNNSSSDDGDLEDDDELLADLERRFQRFCPRSRSSAGFDESLVSTLPLSAAAGAGASGIGGGSGGGDDDAELLRAPARMVTRRSKSCGVHGPEFDQEQLVRRHNAFRMRIGYRDEALRERSERNTQALLQRAMSADRGDAPTTATIIARKALRYRKVFERMEGVDVTDPSLDVSKCLGVHWQRVGSPEQ